MYIAIDIGGTNIRIAKAYTLGGDFKKQKKISILNNYLKDLENIKKIITKFSENNEKMEAIAIGIAGKLNKDKSKSLDLPNLSDWSGKEIKKDLQSAFDCPVYLEDDAVIAGLGEAEKTKVKNDFIFLIWGTGFGGTEISFVNGKMKYFPFEPGHEIIINKNGREGACGHKGDLESYVGGASLEKYYGKKGKELTKEEWDEVLGSLAKGLIILRKAHPYNKVIFGGGIAINNPYKIEILKNILSSEYDFKPEINISKLGDDVGLIGALALIKINS